MTLDVALAGKIDINVDNYTTLELKRTNIDLRNVSILNESAGLQVTNTANVDNLLVLGSLNLDATLSIMNTAEFQGPITFTAATNRDFDISADATLTLKDGFVLDGPTIETGSSTAAKVVVSNSAFMTSGEIIGSGTLELQTLATFNFTGGTIETNINNIYGEIYINSDIGDGSSDFTSTGGKVEIESKSFQGLTLDFSSYTLNSDTRIVCQRDIDFNTGVVDTDNLSITGLSTCTVAMDLTDIQHDISVTDSTLELTSTSGSEDVTASITIDGDGRFMTSGTRYVLKAGGELSLEGSSSFGGQTATISLDDATSKLSLTTDHSSTINLALKMGTSNSGALLVDNSNINLVITSTTGTLTNQGPKWELLSCNSIIVNKALSINTDIDQFCPVTLNSAVSTSSGSTWSIRDDLTIDASFTNGGTLECLGSTITIESSNKLSSGDSLNFDSCTVEANGEFEITGNTVELVDTVINLHAELDLQGLTNFTLSGANSELNYLTTGASIGGGSANSILIVGGTLTNEVFNERINNPTTISGGTLHLKDRMRFSDLTLDSGTNVILEERLTIANNGQGIFEGDIGLDPSDGLIQIGQDAVLYISDGFVFGGNNVRGRDGSRFIVSSGTVYMNDASARLYTTDVSTLEIQSGTNFVFTAGSFEMQLENQGQLNITSDFGNGDSFTSSGTGSEVNIMSTGGSTIDLDFSSYSIASDVYINCIEDIDFGATEVDTDSLTIVGDSGCEVSMDLTNIENAGTIEKPVTITDATLILTSTSGTETVTADITVLGSGEFITSGTKYSLSGSSQFSLEGDSSFGNTVPSISLASATSVLSLTTSHSSQLEMNLGSGTGKLIVDNPSIDLLISGASSLSSSGAKWQFNQCTHVQIDKDWTVGSNVDIFCKTTLLNSNTLTVGAAVNIQDELYIDGDMATTTGGSTSCTSGSINVSGSLTSGQTFSVSGCDIINTGDITLTNPASITWSNADIQQQSGTFDISGITLLRLQSGSSIVWTGGDIDIGTKQLTIDSGLFDIQTAFTLEGTLSLISSTLTSTESATFSSTSSVTIDGLSSMTFDKAVTFEGALSTAASSTVQHSSGTLTFDSNSISISGELTSDGSGVSVVDDITITSTGDVTFNGEITVSQNKLITLNGALNITAGATFSTNSELEADGANAIATIDGSLDVESADFNAINGGSIIFIGTFEDDLTDNTVMTASSGGTVLLGSGEFIGSISANGGTIGVAPGENSECGVSFWDTCTVSVRAGSTFLISSDAYFNFNRGSFSTQSGASSVIHLESGSTFQVDEDLTLTNLLTLFSDGGDVIITDTQDGLTVNSLMEITNGGTLSVENNSDLNVGDNAVIRVTDSEINFEETVIFDGDSKLAISGLTAFNLDNDLRFVDDADLVVEGDTTIHATSDQILIEDDSDFIIDGSGVEAIVEANVEFKNRAHLFVTNNARLVINSDFVSSSNTNFNVTGNSELVLQDTGDNLYVKGDFYIDDSTLELHNGNITLQSGSNTYFTGSGSSTVRSTGSSTGFIILEQGANVYIKEKSPVIVALPVWDDQGGNIFSETFSLSGGSVTETGPGCKTYANEDGTAENVTISNNSALTIEDYGCIIIIDHTVEVEDSAIYIRDYGSLELNNTNLFMNGASAFETYDIGKLHMHTGSSFVISAPVTFSNTFDTSLIVHVLVEDSTFTVNEEVSFTNDAYGSISSSDLNIQSGGLTLAGSSILDVASATVTIDADVTVQANLVVDSSDVVVSGTFKSESSGQATFTSSTFQSNGGTLVVSQASTISYYSTDVYLLAGSDLDISGTATTLVSGSSNVNILGTVSMSSNSHLNITSGSDLEISGTNGLTAKDQANILVNNAELRILSNTFSLNSTSAITLENSGVLNFQSGKISLGDTAQFLMYSGSTFTTQSGASIEAIDDTDILADNSQITLGTGSMIDLSDTATFTVQNAAKADISGSLTMNNKVIGTVTNTNSQVNLSGSLSINNAAKYYITDFGTFNVDGDVTLSNAGNIILEYGDLNVVGSGRLTAQNAAEIRLKFSSSLFIDANEFLMNGNSTTRVYSGSDITVQGGFFNVQEYSDVLVFDGTISVLGNNINIDDHAILSIAGASSSLVANGGDVQIQKNATAQISNSGQFIVTDGQSVCTDYSFITLLNSAEFTLLSSNAASIFNEHCTVTLQSSSTFETQGSTTFTTDSLLIMDNSNFTVFSDSEFSGNSEARISSSSFFTVNGGSVNVMGDALIDVSGSTLTVSSGDISQSSSSTLQFSSNSDLFISGSFYQTDNSNLFIDTSDVEISGLVESIVDSSTFVSSSSTIKILNNGGITLDGRAYWEFNTTSSLSLLSSSNSFFAQRGDSDISFSSSSFNINGFVTLEDDADVFSESSQITISGGGINANGTTLVDVTDNSFFTINDGNVRFCGQSELEIDSTSHFYVFGGTVVFCDTATFDAQPGADVIIAGSFTFEDSTCPTWNGVDFVIEGEFHLTGDCFNVFSSEITVLDGEFATFNDHQLLMVDTELDVNVGSVLFTGTDLSSVHFSNVTLTLIEGLIATNESATLVATDSTIEIQQGIFSIGDVSSSSFDGSNITISDGNLNFMDQSESYASDSSFLIDQGILDLSGSSLVSQDNVNFRITLGTLSMTDNSTFSMIDSDFSMTTSSGDVYADTDAHASFESSNLIITNGNINFNDRSNFTSISSDILVSAGSVIFNTNATLHFSQINNLTIDGGNFDFYDYSSFITDIDCVVDILAGNLRVYDFVEFDFDSVDMYVAGNVRFTDDSQFHTINSDVFIDGGSFVSNVNSDIMISDGSLTVTDGSVSTAGNVQFQLFNTPLLVQGDVVFDGTELSVHYFEDSPITIEAIGTGSASFRAESDVCITAVRSPITIHSGNMEFVSDTCLITDDSPIVVNNGTVFFSETSLLNFTSALSTLTINEGNFELYNTMQFEAVSGSSITINGGNFRVNDFVALDFDNVDIFVGGNVVFTDETELHTINSDIEINGGSFTTDLDVDIQVTDGSLSVIGGSLTTKNDVSFQLFNAPLSVQGDVIFNGTDSSVHYFEDSPITVQANMGPAILQANEDVCITAVRSPITVLTGSIDLNDDTCLIAEDSPIVVNDGSVVFDETTLLSFTTPLSNLTINGGNFSLYDNMEFEAVSGSSITINGGNFRVNDFVALDFDNVDIFVGGNVVFTDETELHTINSDIEINGGSFTTDLDVDIEVTDGSLSVIGGSLTTADNVSFQLFNAPLLVEGNVIFDGTDASVHYFEDSPITIQGFPIEGLLQANEDVCITAVHSPITLNQGSIDFNNDTCLIAEDSPIVVNTGSVIFTDTALLSFTTPLSNLTINGGDFELYDLVEFEAVSGSSITINDGNFRVNDFVALDFDNVDIFVGGNAVFTDETELHTINSDIEINGGSFTTDLDVDIQVTDGSLSVIEGSLTTADNVSFQLFNAPLLVEGDVIFNGTDASVHYFEDSPITIQGFPIEGLLQANEEVCITAVHSPITLHQGSIDFNNDTCLIAEDSPIVVNDGSVVFTDTSLLNFTTPTTTLTINGGDFELFNTMEFEAVPGSSITINDGSFSVNDFVALDFDNVDIFVGGNAAFSDDTQLHTINSDIEINGGSFTTNLNVDIQVTDGSLSVIEGSLTTADNVSFQLFNAPLLVEGDVIFDGTDASVHYFEDSPITIQGFPIEGLLQANEEVCITAVRSPITLHQGSIDFNNDTCLIAEDSPIVVNDGSVVFSETSLLNFTTPTTTLTVNGGDFELSNTMQFEAVPGSSITINDGNFEVNDFVALDFDNVDIFVGGNAAFSDDTQLHTINSDIEINGGTFSSQNNVDIQVTDGSVSVIEGSLTTADNVSFQLFNAPLLVEGDVIFRWNRRKCSLL